MRSLNFFRSEALKPIPNRITKEDPGASSPSPDSYQLEKDQTLREIMTKRMTEKPFLTRTGDIPKPKPIKTSPEHKN
jgi:hypothetical protein